MKHVHVILCIAIIFLCTGFGQPSQDEKLQKHHLNYKGHVTTLRGKVMDVDNISVSGKLRTIKMYEIPVDASHDPAENVTAFDLDQISSLQPAAKEKCAKEHHYKNKQYVEIVVTLSDNAKTENHYLIDASQKIKCDEITGAGPLEREFTFSGLKKLTITGKTERQYNQLYPKDCDCKKE